MLCAKWDITSKCNLRCGHCSVADMYFSAGPYPNVSFSDKLAVLDNLAQGGVRYLSLLGGEPLREDVLLWWNFVARSTEEMQAARADWEAHSPRFGEVTGYDGPRLLAPELNGRLKRS